MTNVEGRRPEGAPRAIGRPVGPPTCDAVPATMIDGTPKKLRHDLVRILGDRQVLHRVIDLVRYAADASPYRLVPKVVVLPRNTADVANVLAYCRENGVTRLFAPQERA
jgi:D-lactate dehydrogenase